MNRNRLQVSFCVSDGDGRQTWLQARDENFVGGNRGRFHDLRVLNQQLRNLVAESEPLCGSDDYFDLLDIRIYECLLRQSFVKMLSIPDRRANHKKCNTNCLRETKSLHP